MRIVVNYEENDYLNYKCPEKDEIIELIISKSVRSNGISQNPMKKLTLGWVIRKININLSSSGASLKLYMMIKKLESSFFSV